MSKKKRTRKIEAFTAKLKSISAEYSHSETTDEHGLVIWYKLSCNCKDVHEIIYHVDDGFILTVFTTEDMINVNRIKQMESIANQFKVGHIYANVKPDYKGNNET